MVCTFSPEGLATLYKMREKDASFTEATKGLLSLKLPQEVRTHAERARACVYVCVCVCARARVCVYIASRLLHGWVFLPVDALKSSF